MSQLSKISSQTLFNELTKPKQNILDLRPMPAYNGWKLQGELRGGHIPGAVAFPHSWFDSFPDEELRTLLKSKGVSPENRIILYAYSQTDLRYLAERLTVWGFNSIRILADGFEIWAADAKLPLRILPKYDQLVYTEWLNHLIDTGNALDFTGLNYRLFHVNFGVPEEYALGHLPGAIYLDSNYLEEPVNWNRRPAHELEAALLSHGITKDTTVILYGRDTTPPEGEQWPGRNAGQISAMRTAAILMYSGVADVRLLDGGYDAWVRAGYPVETEIVSPDPVENFGVTIPDHPEYFIDLDQAKTYLADMDSELVSIRTWSEFIGEESGYNYIAPRGRINGATWGNCGTDAYHMQYYRNPDNTMRAFNEIESNWKLAGITPEKRIAFYCGTGWRASETFFYAYLMGWERVSIYDGGWYEWSKDPDNNPVAVGEPV